MDNVCREYHCYVEIIYHHHPSAHQSKAAPTFVPPVSPSIYKECGGLIGNVLSIYLDKICVRVTVGTLMEELLGKMLEKYAIDEWEQHPQQIQYD